MNSTRSKAKLTRRILYIQYANPAAYPPIAHGARIFADSGCEVRILGIHIHGTENIDIPQSANVRLERIRACSPKLFQKLHFAAFHLWVLWTAALWRPQWVYVNDTMASPSGWLLSKLRLAHVVYHEHDSPYETRARAPKPSLFMRCLLFARRHCARQANLCIIPNEARALIFRNETATRRPIYCVWNCPMLREASLVSPRQTGGGLIVFYHGSVVPQRLPLAVIHALTKCPREIRLRFAGYETLGHRGYISALLSHAKHLAIAERVSYLGVFPRAELLQLCREGQVGLALMPPKSDDLNMNAIVGASNKPFDYLLCGLPLLVPRRADWQRMFVDKGLARACDPADASSIADALCWFLTHPEERKSMGAAGRERIAREWNYESQFAPVLGHILGKPTVSQAVAVASGLA